MKQIYIHTHLGTTRIDYNEDLPGDIIIDASTIGHIYGVIQEHIECTNIDSKDTDDYFAEPAYVILPRALVADQIPAEAIRFLNGENY